MTAAPLSWQKSRSARLGRALVLAAGLAASPAAAAGTESSNLAVGAIVVDTCRVSTGPPARPEAAVSCGRSNPDSVAVDRPASSRNFPGWPGERRASAARTQTAADSGNVTYVTVTY